MFITEKKVKKLLESRDNRISELEMELWRLKNPPKYKEGQRLKDGTTIIKVDTLYRFSLFDCEHKYSWCYLGIKNGVKKEIYH